MLITAYGMNIVPTVDLLDLKPHCAPLTTYLFRILVKTFGKHLTKAMSKSKVNSEILFVVLSFRLKTSFMDR